MRKCFISPSKYVQGEGELKNLGYFIKTFGKSALLVASKSGVNRVRLSLDETSKKYGVSFIESDFDGECTTQEVLRLKALSEKNNCSCIVGLGGGKAIDAAKCVANGGPIIIVPTIAATDAPTSSSSVLYTENGVVDHFESFNQSPSVVLVDTEIIASSPVRLLVSGMGDALATYFEARATERSYSEVFAGFSCGSADNSCPPAKQTKTAMALARLCYETLLADGLKAKQACELNIVTPALENVVEANILLSGLGFESGGLAAAHSIHNGLTLIPQCRDTYHGEKVAFGTLCQLMLENAPLEEIEAVLAFCLSIGLPICFEDLGVKSVSDHMIMEAAKRACAPGEAIHGMPFPIRPEAVAAAILAADKIGSHYKCLNTFKNKI